MFQEKKILNISIFKLRSKSNTSFINIVKEELIQMRFSYAGSKMFLAKTQEK